VGEKSDAITARLITSIFSPYRNVGTNLPHVAMLVREHCLRMQLCSCRRPHRQHTAASINAVCFLVNASRAFLLRDATLAPYMLSACVCLSVCLSVCRSVHNCDCDVTATRNKRVHFSARLHELAANHNAGIDVGVVDRLWRHCLLLFSRVSTKKIKAIYCWPLYFLSSLIIRRFHTLWNLNKIDVSK